MIIWNIFLHLNISKIKQNQQKLFSGKNGVDLEKTILFHSQSIKELDQDIQDLFGISNQIHNLAAKSVHKVGVVDSIHSKIWAGTKVFPWRFSMERIQEWFFPRCTLGKAIVLTPNLWKKEKQ